MPLFAYEEKASVFTPPTEMFRGQANSNGPVWEDVDMDSYVIPPTGDYDLRLVGFAKPYQQPISKEYQRKGGPTESTKTSLEFEIISEHGKGYRFLWNFITWSLAMGTRGNPSHMGRIYKAGVLKGGNPDGPLAFENLIGCEFHAHVVASEDWDDEGNPKYCTIEPKSITTLQAGSAAKKYDPFSRKTSAKAPETLDEALEQHADEVTDNTFDEEQATN
jgi:hypothetical protein